MKFNEYQIQSAETAHFPLDIDLLYCGLKLNGEAGEVAEKIGKAVRDGHCQRTPIGIKLDDSIRLGVIKELGDVLWYVAMMATLLGVPLDEVAQGNIDKLADRKARNVLGGSGDDR